MSRSVSTHPQHPWVGHQQARIASRFADACSPCPRWNLLHHPISSCNHSSRTGRWTCSLTLGHTPASAQAAYDCHTSGPCYCTVQDCTNVREQKRRNLDTLTRYEGDALYPSASSPWPAAERIIIVRSCSVLCLRKNSSPHTFPRVFGITTTSPHS